LKIKKKLISGFPMNNRLMLIDDSVTIHRVIDLCVDTEKYEITKCFSAEEGLHKMKTYKPGVVFLDNKLDGIKLSDYVESIKQESGAWVVLLVGAFDQFGEDDLIASAADDFIFKPFDAQALDEKIALGIKTVASLSGPEEETAEEEIPPVTEMEVNETEASAEEVIAKEPLNQFPDEEPVIPEPSDDEIIPDNISDKEDDNDIDVDGLSAMLQEGLESAEDEAEMPDMEGSSVDDLLGQLDEEPGDESEASAESDLLSEFNMELDNPQEEQEVEFDAEDDKDFSQSEHEIPETEETGEDILSELGFSEEPEEKVHEMEECDSGFDMSELQEFAGPEESDELVIEEDSGEDLNDLLRTLGAIDEDESVVPEKEEEPEELMSGLEDDVAEKEEVMGAIDELLMDSGDIPEDVTEEGTFSLSSEDELDDDDEAPEDLDEDVDRLIEQLSADETMDVHHTDITEGIDDDELLNEDEEEAIIDDILLEDKIESIGDESLNDLMSGDDDFGDDEDFGDNEDEEEPEDDSDDSDYMNGDLDLEGLDDDDEEMPEHHGIEPEDDEVMDVDDEDTENFGGSINDIINGDLDDDVESLATEEEIEEFENDDEKRAEIEKKIEALIDGEIDIDDDSVDDILEEEEAVMPPLPEPIDDLETEPQKTSVEISPEYIKEVISQSISEELIRDAVTESVSTKLGEVIKEILPGLLEQAIIDEIERLKKG